MSGTGVRRRALVLARLRGSGRGDDRGVMAIIVAICVVVLLGLGTIVIDVGSMYFERRQLQNGADAGALAVALDCAKTTCAGGGSALATATAHADSNANDATATVNEVCGTAPGLPPCSPAPQGPWDCPAQPSTGPLATAPYVQVRTQTLSNGTALLPPVLARVLEPGYTGSTVRACARVAYGTPGSATVVAVTESYCEWLAATGNGSSFAPQPPYPPNPDPSFERVIYEHGTSKALPCPAGPAGSDLPGGFGFLDDLYGNCSTTVSVNGTYGDDTGVNVSQACRNALSTARTNRTVVYLPIYGSLTGTGTNGVYTLKGFAAFVITGYSLPGFNANSWITGKKPCTGSDKCISGFFTHGLVPAGGVIGGGSQLGASVLQMTG